MTKEEKIAMLKSLTDEPDEDMLSTYLFLSEQIVMARAYPYGGATEVPAMYEGLVIEIGQYLLNKRGAEGQTSHTENGITRQYADAEVPTSLLRRIVPCAGVIK